MKLSLSSLRALAALIVSLMMASLLSVLTITTATSAHAEDGEPHGKAEAAAESPQTLTLTIAAPEGTAEVAGYLELYWWDDDGQSFALQDATEVSADSARTSVDFEVLPGRYYAGYNSYKADVTTPAYSADATVVPTMPTDPGVFQVTAGTDAEASITLKARASLSGSVTYPDGSPADDAWVDVYAADADPSDGALYDASVENGSFNIPVDQGTWRVVVRSGNEDYLDHTYDDVTLTPGEQLTLPDLTLRAAAVATMSGAVTLQGSPQADLDVELLRVHGPEEWDYQQVTSTTTDSNGEYTLAGIREDRTYTIRVSGMSISTTFLGGVGDYADATTFTGTDESPLPTIAALPRAEITGTLTGDGAPAQGRVTAYRVSQDGSDNWTSEVETDEEGNFSLSVPGGDYRLLASPHSAAYLATYLGSQRSHHGYEAGSFPAAPGDSLTKNISLLEASVLTGSVQTNGAPLADASVAAYVWENSEYWSYAGEARTDATGAYEVPVPDGAKVTVRVSRKRFVPQFLGGGTELPEAPTATNSVTVNERRTAVPAFSLVPTVSDLGKVAGEPQSWCLTSQVESNDDSSSAAVRLPFPLSFYGMPYEELFVNNNGNVTFGQPLSDYTPSDLTGDTNVPMIAPFFADVDTRGEDSAVVTYGASPDGKQFCVNWADVGHYSQGSRLNTFQLILTRNDTGAGRVPGDFDIRFNYDKVIWEAGTASGSNNEGLGGVSAAVGFTNGTGEVGTHVQLDGSLVNGALLDGGPRSLVGNSQRSTQTGRYNFEVRNEGISVSLGNIEGTVTDGTDGVADATVQVCRTTGAGGCTYTETDGAGEYRLTAVRAGAYTIRVWPVGDLFGGGTTATVVAGETTAVPDIVLSRPIPVPAGSTVNGTTGDVPSVLYTEPTTLVVNGCAGVANPRVTVTLADGRQVQSVAMTESPAGRYSATIPPLYPNTGDATVSTNVPATCGGVPVKFNIYIDPAGIVTDQWGRPIEDASVLLHRSDTESGTYAVVPNGSDIMSASNRSNPSTTDEVGYFRWDVIPGWYRVDASAPGCTGARSDNLEVPPERIALVLKLTCDVAPPAATTAPRITGSGEVGSQLKAIAGTWPDPLTSTGIEWLRNGVVDPSITGATYTPTAADTGTVFTVRDTARRPDEVSDSGSADDVNVVVSFLPVSATSARVTVVARPRPTPPPTATPTATPRPTPTPTASPRPTPTATASPRPTPTASPRPTSSPTPTASPRPTSSPTPTAGPRPTPAPTKKVKATVKVKGPKKVTSTQRAKITVKVTATGAKPRPAATGYVVVKMTAKGKVKGKKVRTMRVKLKRGSAKIKLPKLAKGKWVVRVTYSGNAKISKASSKKYTLKVTAPKKAKKRKR